jgi:hypothetical protein
VSDDSVPLALPLLRLAAGSSEVTNLYRELRKPLLRYLICLGLTSDEAQDVVQDAFVSLQRHLSSGGDQENIRGWLFRVAHNQARNRQTSYDRRFGEALDGKKDLQANDTTPEEVVLEKEKFRRLAAGVQANEFRAGVPAAQGGRTALPRNRRNLGNSHVHGGRHSGARDDETNGEMQCVTFKGN